MYFAWNDTVRRIENRESSAWFFCFVCVSELLSTLSNKQIFDKNRVKKRMGTSANLITIICFYAIFVLSEAKIAEESLEKNDKSCYDLNDDPYIQFASKTAYRFNQNKGRDEIKPEGMSFLVLTLLFTCLQNTEA